MTPPRVSTGILCSSRMGAMLAMRSHAVYTNLFVQEITSDCSLSLARRNGENRMTTGFVGLSFDDAGSQCPMGLLASHPNGLLPHPRGTRRSRNPELLNPIPWLISAQFKSVTNSRVKNFLRATWCGLLKPPSSTASHLLSFRIITIPGRTAKARVHLFGASSGLFRRSQNIWLSELE